MRLTARLLAVLALIALSAGCKSEDPNAPETWVARLDAKSKKERATAIERLRKLGAKSTVPAIIAKLKDGGDVKTEAARAIGELGEAAIAVPALIDAIDFAVADGTDRESKASNEANKEIADALGAFGDKAAVDPLIKLAERSKNNLVRVAAINSLGEIGDAKAVEPLMKLALNQALEPYINKKAIQALGTIGDPAAVPAIKEMLFHERRGISFYAESSLAAYQIGLPASAPLLTVLEGKDAELKKMAAEQDIYEEALYAKAAQVLGDLQERKAIPTLVRYVNYRRPGIEADEIDQLSLLVRMQAAEALGRMRAKEGADAIARQLKELEGNSRGAYVRALVMLGDRKVLPALTACATSGDPMDKSNHARLACYEGLSRLGDEKTLAQWEAWEKAEPAASTAACGKQVEADDEAGKKAAAEHCKALGENVVKILKENKSRLVAYAACKEDVDCWVGKLKDSDAKVRERASYELGRIGDAKAVVPLMAALTDKALEARYASILGTDGLASGSKDALEAAKKGLAALKAQIEEESGKVQFAKINEDLRRLALKIRRLDRTGS